MKQVWRICWNVRISGIRKNASARSSPRCRRTAVINSITIPSTACFALRGLLGKGLAFPYDFGFIPSTLGMDGDPLDVVVLMDEPAHVGCLLDVRIIGLIEPLQAEDGKRITNDRLVGVTLYSYSHENLRSINEVSTCSRQKSLNILSTAVQE